MANKFPATTKEIARLIFGRLCKKREYYDIFSNHKTFIENTIFEVLDEYEAAKLRNSGD